MALKVLVFPLAFLFPGPAAIGGLLLATEENVPFHYAMALTIILLIGSGVIAHLFLKKMDKFVESNNSAKMETTGLIQYLHNHDQRSRDHDANVKAQIDTQGERIGKLCEQMQELLIKQSAGICPFNCQPEQKKEQK